MSHQPPKANAEHSPHDRPFVSEIPKLQKLIEERGYTGLANDTKWNELLRTMRDLRKDEWAPSYRFNCIDSDFISGWDVEWWHHLPFPFFSVRWFEIGIPEVGSGEQTRATADEIEAILSRIGFDFVKGRVAFRIFGYAPRDYREFEPSHPQTGC